MQVTSMFLYTLMGYLPLENIKYYGLLKDHFRVRI